MRAEYKCVLQLCKVSLQFILLSYAAHDHLKGGVKYCFQFTKTSVPRANYLLTIDEQLLRSLVFLAVSHLEAEANSV